MPSFLMVPTNITGILLSQSLPVTPPDADFTKLPWQSPGAVDVNPGNPPLGSTITEPHFNKATGTMNAGVHLHWQIPRAFTIPRKDSHENPDDAERNYPEVPNTWLVFRFRKKVMEKMWAVKSDWMQDTADVSFQQTVVPVSYEHNSPPYRYLGKQIALTSLTNVKAQFTNHKKQSRWHNFYTPPAAVREEALTAIAYGDPNFAAFYPNSNGVFSFYDSTITPADTDIQYMLLGMYEEDNHDPVLKFSNKFKKAKPGLNDVAAAFGLTNPELLDKAALTPIPLTPDCKTLCYGLFTVNNSDAFTDPNAVTDKLTWVIGNSVTEALSSLLANTIGAGTLSIAQLEEQLASIIHNTQLPQNTTNLLSEFYSACHADGFKQHSGGLYWSIETRSTNTNTGVSGNTPAGYLDFYPGLFDSLDSINRLQYQKEKCEIKIKDAKAQLFTDWCKLMMVHYSAGTLPFPDKVLLDALANLIQEGIDNTHNDPKDVNSLTHVSKSLHKAINDIQNDIGAVNTDNKTNGFDWEYVLKVSNRNAFWSPKEPVLLVAGIQVNIEEQTGDLGPSPSFFYDLPAGSNDIDSPAIVNSIFGCLSDTVRFPVGANGITANRKGWNPFMMEWEVQHTPVPMKDNNGEYLSKAIHGSFSVDEGSAEFKYSTELDDTPANVPAAVTPFTVQGASVLSPFHSLEYQFKIATYLAQQLKIDLDSNTKPDSTIEAVKDFIKKNKPTLTPVQSTAQNALNILGSFNILSQSLQGFNKALQMLETTLQAPMVDPLGSYSRKSVTYALADLVKDSHHYSPDFNSQFWPLRSGHLNLMRVRLKDNFGVVKEYNISGTGVNHFSKSLSQVAIPAPAAIPLPFLMPRITLPMRLNAGWLSSANPGHHFHHHIPTNPVYGYLVIDELNVSLIFYDTDGTCLGFLDSSKQWIPAPSSTGSSPKSISSIANGHLRKVVEWLAAASTDIAAFVDNANFALNNIVPPGFSGSNALSLLVSRPMAITRISFGVQLKEANAVDQSWDALVKHHATLGRHPAPATGYRHKGYRNVKLPVRLGSFSDTHDGLVAYWPEKVNARGGYMLEKMVLSQHVIGRNGAPTIPADYINFCSPNDEPLTATVLMDPLGSINFYSGVLPVQKLSMPEEWISSTLQKICPLLRFGPILNAKGDAADTTAAPKLYMPHGVEPGYQWEWFKDANTVGDVLQPPTSAFLKGQFYLQSGYIKLKPAN